MKELFHLSRMIHRLSQVTSQSKAQSHFSAFRLAATLSILSELFQSSQ
jgi:hypothetical protein